MCGLAGIINFVDGVDSHVYQIVQNMIEHIKHRGPDDKGFFHNKFCSMGHNRLAIIDLETGHQPMYNKERSLVVTFNGEIYNYPELKKILSNKGYNFITKSDTEVIVHGFEEWKEDLFTKLNGMFAIAIYNITTNELFLVRDRSGMKPLYYYYKDNAVIWSSEIKAILISTYYSKEYNPHTLIDFFTFQNTVDEKTFFKDIYKVEPGHYVKVNAKGLLIKQYWDIDFSCNTSFSNIQSAQENYNATFDRAVQRHLLSDVEIGSYLSGGFDSSSVAYRASQTLKYNMKTFTGYFEGGSKYDERNITRLFSKEYKNENIEVRITSKDFLEDIGRVIYHLDEPTLGSGAFPQFAMAKEVSKHLKVILTGHGGDELFAGYQVFKSSFYKDLFKSNKIQFLKHFWNNRPDEILKILYFSFWPLINQEVEHGLFIMFGEKARNKLFTNNFREQWGQYSSVQNLTSKYLHNKRLSKTEQTLYLYLKTYLPTLFIQEDKMTMAHSIEGRMPLCDNQMIELSAKIPYEYKLYHNELKYLTKSMMRNKFPQCFYKHPKMGFPTPIAKWFKNELKDLVYDVLVSSKIKDRGVFNANYIKSLIDFHIKWGKETLYDYVRANKIYSLFMTELWFQKFID